MTSITIKIETHCPFCQKPNPVIEATKDQYLRYLEGKESVQYIFPHLSPQEREALITGMCDNCWRKAIEE